MGILLKWRFFLDRTTLLWLLTSPPLPYGTPNPFIWDPEATPFILPQELLRICPVQVRLSKATQERLSNPDLTGLAPKY